MCEILLTGGRITNGVVKIKNTVHRPIKPNADFTHRVLQSLQKDHVSFVPKYLGQDEQNREILTYLEGDCPADLGDFSISQCQKAAQMIKIIHSSCQDLIPHKSALCICHGDLSPCNFIFSDDLPCGVIDWDTAHLGDPLSDLGYAIWLWSDMGSPHTPVTEIFQKFKAMADAYGLSKNRYPDLLNAIQSQMQRISTCSMPTPHQTAATNQWGKNCLLWLSENKSKLCK